MHSNISTISNNLKTSIKNSAKLNIEEQDILKSALHHTEKLQHLL
jgi:hypothetical protein